MAFRLNRSDRELLAVIAEYRMLTVRQVVVLLRRNRQVVRRRLLALERASLLMSSVQQLGRGRGRPEKLVSLSGDGIEVLRSEGKLDSGVPDHRVLARPIRCIDHQVLVNWFRIRLAEVETIVPTLRARFLSPTSPFLPVGPDDRPLVSDRAQIDRQNPDETLFTPDGVGAMTDISRDKTVLFFLEVDMGTETLASPRKNRSDVRHKILAYRAYFRDHGYKRYEGLWHCGLRGFRLLFLTHSPARYAALCRLVRDMPPSDFIWVSDAERVLSVGAWAHIWVRGGRQEQDAESILGSLAPDPVSRPPEAFALGA